MLWTLTIVPSVFCVDAVLRVYAQTRFLFAMNLLRLAIVAGSIGWFLSAFGLSGAVLVTLVSTALVRIAGIARIARLMGLGIGDALPWPRLLAIGAAAVVAAVPAIWLGPATLAAPLALLYHAAIYGTVYLAICYGAARSEHATTPLRLQLKRRLSAFLTEG
jgi:hypothetical protein